MIPIVNPKDHADQQAGRRGTQSPIEEVAEQRGQGELKSKSADLGRQSKAPPREASGTGTRSHRPPMSVERQHPKGGDPRAKFPPITERLKGHV